MFQLKENGLFPKTKKRKIVKKVAKIKEYQPHEQYGKSGRNTQLK